VLLLSGVAPVCLGVPEERSFGAVVARQVGIDRARGSPVGSLGSHRRVCVWGKNVV